jgi:hypothetical protein
MEVSRTDFSSVYQACVREMAERMPTDWSAPTKHSADWGNVRFDHQSNLVTSEIHYWYALRFSLGENAPSELSRPPGSLPVSRHAA